MSPMTQAFIELQDDLANFAQEWEGLGKSAVAERLERLLTQAREVQVLSIQRLADLHEELAMERTRKEDLAQQLVDFVMARGEGVAQSSQTEEDELSASHQGGPVLPPPQYSTRSDHAESQSSRDGTEGNVNQHVLNCRSYSHQAQAFLDTLPPPPPPPDENLHALPSLATYTPRTASYEGYSADHSMVGIARDAQGNFQRPVPTCALCYVQGDVCDGREPCGRCSLKRAACHYMTCNAGSACLSMTCTRLHPQQANQLQHVDYQPY